MCLKNFVNSKTIIDHLKVVHGVPSIYKFQCKQQHCSQIFQNIYTFKEHLKKHEKHLLNSTQNIDIHESFILKSSAPLMKLDINSQTNIPSNDSLCHNSSKEHASENLLKISSLPQFTDINKSMLSMSLNLIQKSSIPRKMVFEIQEI